MLTGLKRPNYLSHHNDPVGFPLMKGEALSKISEQLQNGSEKAEKISFSFNDTFYDPQIKHVY